MPYLGEIAVFAAARVPQGYTPCDGQLLAIASHRPLFAILGATYGGDGQSTFALPDFRARVPVHQRPAPGSGESRLGEHGGEDKATLQPCLGLNFCIALEGELPRLD